MECCGLQHGQDKSSSFAFDTSIDISLDIDSLRREEIKMSKIYADSLNRWTNGSLPKFLERDIENEYQNLSEDVHHLQSFRKAVFDQVHNSDVLMAIIRSKNKLYSVKGEASQIPYSSLSVKDLAEMRYHELSRRE